MPKGVTTQQPRTAPRQFQPSQSYRPLGVATTIQVGSIVVQARRVPPANENQISQSRSTRRRPIADRRYLIGNTTPAEPLWNANPFCSALSQRCVACEFPPF